MGANQRAVILTGSELRHVYVRKAIGLSAHVQVVRSYCEGLQNHNASEGDQAAHLDARARSERDFFGAFAALAPDATHPVEIPRGSINDPERCRDIVAQGPDLLAAYGCSIVREPLLSAFTGRFLNVHLGLSPYYRGSGTNFWALVNGEPEYVGATFMHLAAGVDTGEIIHQMRARVYPGDSPHQIGNRLIADMAVVYAALIGRFAELRPMPQPQPPANARVCRNRDFTPEATQSLYRGFAAGLVDRYLAEQQARCDAAPIVVNPLLADL